MRFESLAHRGGHAELQVRVGDLGPVPGPKEEFEGQMIETPIKRRNKAIPEHIFKNHNRDHMTEALGYTDVSFEQCDTEAYPFLYLDYNEAGQYHILKCCCQYRAFSETYKFCVKSRESN